MFKSDFEGFFNPEGSKVYAVKAHHAAEGWNAEVGELHLNFSVESEPEVFSHAITLIARHLGIPPFRVLISVQLPQ